MSSSVPVGALVGWMVLLTVKHIIADFVLQTAWMAHGKDQKTGWALPLHHRLLRDWTISTDIRAYTGQPFTPIVSSKSAQPSTSSSVSW